MFDGTMTTLSQDRGGVDVTFEKAAPRRFDLVIGADGLHSASRRLALGPSPSSSVTRASTSPPPR